MRRLFLLSLLSLAAILLTHITNAQKGNCGGKVKVLTLNRDGAQRGNTLAEYGEPIAVRGDYTLCLRFNIIVFRLLTAVIYILDQKDYDELPISLDVYFEKIRTKYGGYGRFYPLPNNLATNKWYFYCQTRNSSGGEGRVYLDGELLVQETIAFATDEAVRDTIMGQDEYMPPYSMSGQLSQVNMWRRVLSHEEILSLTRCEVDLEGDIISWSGPWKVYNAEEKYVSMPELCQSVNRGRMTVPLPSLRYHDSVQLCRGLRGYFDVPATMAAVYESKKFFEGVSDCARVWAGADDEAVEGVWHNPFTGVNMDPSEMAFKIHNPDGDKYQNCILLRDSGLLDTDCKKHSCAACHTTAGSTWTLRGTCEEEERMYYFDLVALPMSFRGYGEYRVRKVEDTWVWYNSVTNTTMATLSPLSLNYPVGRLTWDLKAEVCGQEGGQRMLTLSPCVPGEFTCDDGSCIAFSKRCDLKFDCKDKTDESFCDIVNFPGDYRSRLPPRPASDEALPIAVSVSMDTLNIDTTTMLLSVSYNLRMTWLDNRLTYNNLKPLTRLNTVSQEQVAQLWRPQVGFINTDDIQQTKVDEDAVTTVFRQHKVYTPNLANPYEVEIYRGDTNPLSTSRKYFTIYTCNFDLVLYPFDIQKCYLRLQIISASSEYLVFNINDSTVNYFGEKFLVEYGIGKIDLKEGDGGQYSEIQVQVELIRRYGFAMLNIYIPSVTLLTISYVTLYFRPTIFEVRVMTALTAQLVLATLFTQVSTSLPKTSYFKMVDIWLLFCILLIFFIIIFHTIIDLNLDYGDGSFTSSNPLPKISTGSIGVTRVSPINADGKEEKKDYKEMFKLAFSANDVKFYIIFSKCTIFTIFLLFNAIYWGTLAKDSGLVYYY
ncbi:uncharacterized protein LOC123506251 [Portunus trituberculatus]|uniref:uncharacterized protein LOC123506251 n=1 Tax=Portunus trituberculatus TaxID=210409 RepID=UPI001E1CD307|nr:uncharacterized protein LOC123506251 [Portunus trituberculatus]